MKLNERAVVYIPDGAEEKKALSRTTHLAISAHQDDIEFMAYSPIAECFGKKDQWFCGVVTTDGAGSPRSGIYANFTDEDMKKIRIAEQKKAAFVGEYSAQILLGYSSAEVKKKQNESIVSDFLSIFRAARPKYVYTHNLADKHDTHVATALKVIEALRLLEKDEKPEKVYLDCGAHPNLSRCLSSVFDSQITGGKRYDLAAEGRRLANATFSASHACDTYAGLNYAMDLTPLMADPSIDIGEYVAGFIQRFEKSVRETIQKFSGDR